MTLIVLVNYNGKNDTLYCIKSLTNIRGNDYRIVIVDNNSQDNSVAFLIKNINADDITLDVIDENGQISDDKLVTIIKSQNNRGFAYANNIAIKCANKINYDYVWLLNNDTIVQENTLSVLIECAQTQPSSVGIIGTKLLFLDSPDMIQAMGGKYNKSTARCYHIGAYELDTNQYDRFHSPDYIVGASMFVKREFIEDVGLMTEDYFLYFEELDWILRGNQKGWKIYLEPNAIVYHKEGGSTRKNNKASIVSEKYSLRNRIIFTKRFYPENIISVSIFALLTIFKRIVTGDFRIGYILINTYLTAIFKSK